MPIFSAVHSESPKAPISPLDPMTTPSNAYSGENSDIIAAMVTNTTCFPDTPIPNIAPSESPKVPTLPLDPMTIPSNTYSGANPATIASFETGVAHVPPSPSSIPLPDHNHHEVTGTSLEVVSTHAQNVNSSATTSRGLSKKRPGKPNTPK